MESDTLLFALLRRPVFLSGFSVIFGKPSPPLGVLKHRCFLPGIIEHVGLDHAVECLRVTFLRAHIAVHNDNTGRTLGRGVVLHCVDLLHARPTRCDEIRSSYPRTTAYPVIGQSPLSVCRVTSTGQFSLVEMTRTFELSAALTRT